MSDKSKIKNFKNIKNRLEEIKNYKTGSDPDINFLDIVYNKLVQQKNQLLKTIRLIEGDMKSIVSCKMRLMRAGPK